MGAHTRASGPSTLATGGSLHPSGTSSPPPSHPSTRGLSAAKSSLPLPPPPPPRRPRPLGRPGKRWLTPRSDFGGPSWLGGTGNRRLDPPTCGRAATLSPAREHPQDGAPPPHGVKPRHLGAFRSTPAGTSRVQDGLEEAFTSPRRRFWGMKDDEHRHLSAWAFPAIGAAQDGLTPPCATAGRGER